MAPDRWERVKDVFDAALDLDAPDRPAYLIEACAGDEELRSQVDRLLREHEDAGASFLRTGDGHAARSGPEEPSREDELLNGRYRVGRELGRGGSGVVYLARDEQLHGRPVVVKFLYQRAGRHPVLRARFHSELEALARIRHPGVVNLLDFGELPGGEEFLVMEYVEGATLRSSLGPAGISLDRAARLLRQICAALSAAHERGVFHRDLKPENIMLAAGAEGGETVKLIDFGIAKVEQTQAPNQTETWTFMGTINYVAPEQLLGKAGAAADIWALGVIAYELVTGRRPYQPGTPFQLFEMQRAQRIADPARLRPGLPAAVRAAILRALSFRPEDRQPSPSAFAAEFCGAVEGRGSRFAWAYRRRLWSRAAAAALVATLAVAGWQWYRRAASPQQFSALDLSINTPLGAAADAQGNVYFSEYANNRVWRVGPSGRATVAAGTGFAAFSGNGGPAARAAIQSPRTLALDGGKYLYIVETTTDRVRRVDLASGIITHVLGVGRPRFNGDGLPGPETAFSEGLGLAVTPSGDLLFSDTNNHRIRRLSAADGRVTTIAGDGVRGFSGDGGPALSARLGRPAGLALHPDGSLYYFDIEAQRIRRIRNGIITTVAGSDTATAVEGPALEVRLGASTGMTMDPAGSAIYYTEESFDTLRRLDLAAMTIRIVAGNLVQGSTGDGGPARAASMANPTGVAVGPRGDIYVAEAAGNRIRRIDPAGRISTFAGGKVPYASRASDAPALPAFFLLPR